MIINLSKLKVFDNSGVVYIKCFKVYKSSVGSIGSLVYGSIKDNKSKSKLRKGDIVRGIIVLNKKMINRQTGSFVFFGLNGVVLLNDKHELLGTRVFCPLPLELRKKRYLKLLSLASILI